MSRRSAAARRPPPWCFGACSAGLAAWATVPAMPVGAAFAVEWLLSFALMFVIMAVATTHERLRTAGRTS